MKKYLLILAAILFLWGCIAEDRTECPKPRGTFVSLTVRPEKMSSVTRSVDETTIRNLNFYLCDTAFRVPAGQLQDTYCRQYGTRLG